jgi:hypothetical protein
MNEMEVTLCEKYGGDFFTTIRGAVVKKKEFSVVDVEDIEVQHALKSGILIPKCTLEESKEEDKVRVIQDDIPKTAFREVVTQSNEKSMKKSIEKLKENGTETTEREEDFV